MTKLKYYRISEFADEIGISPVTLRVWERKGILVPHHRSPSGYRFYSEEQLYQYLNGDFNKKSDRKLVNEDVKSTY